MLAMDAGEILGIFGHDLKQVIRGPRHQVAFQHIGNTRDRFFKGVQHLVRLALQGDLDKHRRGDAHLARVQQGDVIADIPFGFQPLHAPVTGRRRKMYLFRQVRVRHPPVALQGSKDAAIDVV